MLSIKSLPSISVHGLSSPNLLTSSMSVTNVGTIVRFVLVGLDAPEALRTYSGMSYTRARPNPHPANSTIKLLSCREQLVRPQPCAVRYHRDQERDHVLFFFPVSQMRRQIHFPCSANSQEEACQLLPAPREISTAPEPEAVLLFIRSITLSRGLWVGA